MSIVSDRRTHSGSHSGSHERFIQRNRGAIRKAINKSLQDGNITDIGKNGTDVTVPSKDISEPTFTTGRGGVREKVLPGNNNEKARFKTGDRIPKPQGGGGGGGGPGDGAGKGEGNDDFTFHLSEEEFLNILFEELELPNMFKQGAIDSLKTTMEHAGFASRGPFSRLSIPRSKMKKMERTSALSRKANDEILTLLEEEKLILQKYAGADDILPACPVPLGPSTKEKIRTLGLEVDGLKDIFSRRASPDETARMDDIDTQIANLDGQKRGRNKWNEKLDLKFRTIEPQPLPTSKAVMFCVMDVSGSMDEEKKTNAKIFYFLLYRFLKRNYDHVETVFIRHTETATEVDEHEFFYGTKSGGTVVSSGLEKLIEIQAQRYPEKEWNIYGAQASDGDNSGSDDKKSAELLDTILNLAQGYFYTEVKGSTWSRGLWTAFEAVAAKRSDRFWMGKVTDRKDIWPLFREFFKKREGGSPTLQSRSAAFAPN